MTLQPGTRLGPYEIVSPIGAGGMGEVYRARDTRLDRAVAIKVLLHGRATSVEAVDRLEREARAISQLSHPHICQLLDVGTEEGTSFLVMELVEGGTLADRLVKGPLPIDATLLYAHQIAQALDAAHRRAIVHRDVKPSNVMLPKSGLKLLDFGLAKESAADGGTLAVTTPVTAHGALAGTIQYMAPEVLEGHPADHRSDIFALGAVIYEMATGERLFRTAQKTLSPPALDRIVRGCLEQDPDDRWQSAHDVARQLAGAAERDAVAGVPSRRAVWLPWALAVMSLAAAAATAWFRPGPTTSTLPDVRFHVMPPTGGSFYDNFENVTVALSPDGTQLAFVALDAERNPRLFLRPVSSLESRPLEGSERALSVSWSPDGRSVVFSAGGKLTRIDLPSGAPVTLCDVQDNIGLTTTWGDGSILFASVGGQALYRVSATGGTPVVEVKPDQSRGERRTTFPSFLPDGRRYLYLVRMVDGGQLMLGEPGKPPKALLPVVSNVQYVEPGYLIYAQEGTLFAQPFDAGRGEISGTPYPIADSIRYNYSTAVGRFSASRNGALVYQSGREVNHLGWIDRGGHETGIVGTPGSLNSLRISPDGSHVLYSRAHERLGTYDLWNADLTRGVEQRLTSDRTSEFNGVWHPSGKLIFFSADRGGPPHLYRKDLTNGEEAELLPPTGFQAGEDVVRAGNLLVFTERATATIGIFTLALDGDRRRAPLVETRFTESQPRLSPDNRFLAFTSNENGRTQVYVSEYPPTGMKTPVSSGAGLTPRWSRDGRELFYLTFDRRMMMVPVRTSPTLSLGTPVELFGLPGRGLWRDYDVAPDGKGFLAAVIDVFADAQPVAVETNWQAGRARSQPSLDR